MIHILILVIIVIIKYEYTAIIGRVNLFNQ